MGLYQGAAYSISILDHRLSLNSHLSEYPQIAKVDRVKGLHLMFRNRAKKEIDPWSYFAFLFNFFLRLTLNCRTFIVFFKCFQLLL